MRLRDEHRAVAGRVEWTHEAAQPHRHRARDDAELACTEPLPLALRQQCLVGRETEDAPAERQQREIAGSAAAANRRAEQHNAAGRQRRVALGGAPASSNNLEQLQND